MKTRKLLAVVLAVAMLASFISVPVFADGHEGGVLEDLGILIGPDEDGVTEDYLASTATRAQAALVHLRLFGLEADALAFEGTETFMDAATATEYWQPILEYLKANPELGWQGDDEGNFMPTGAITGQQFTKVLLVALGYVEGTDFMYEETMTFAAGIGLDALADKADMDLTVEDLAVALVQALGLETAGPEGWNLISQLVDAGLVDETAAEAAGFEVMPPAFVVVSAEATATDEVTVMMSTEIPEGTSITLKKGTIGIVTTEEVDGDTAVLTGLYNFLPGTYTVMVGEAVSAPFEIAAQTATELTIGAETIYDEAGQDLMVKLADQYGDAMSLTGTNISVFNQDTGWVYDTTVDTTITIDPTDGTTAGEAGDTIYVFVYDPVSQLQATATVLVVEAPYLAGISIVGYTWNVDDEDDVRFYVGDTTALLDVECVDQYGQEYTLTSADIDEGWADPDKVQVLVSNDTVLGVETTPDGGDLVITGAGAGTAIVTLVLPSMSIIEQSEMITVYATPVLDSLEVVGQTETYYAMEDGDFGLVGYDQYGDPIDFDGGDDIDFTINNGLVLTSGGIGVTDTNEVTATPHGDGTATVFVFLGGELQGQADITVNPEAYPYAVTAVDAAEAMETGVSDTVEAGDLTVIDQYGREMDAPFTGLWSWELSEVTDDGHVALTGGGVVLSTAGLTAGTDSFQAYLTYDGDAQVESAFQFDVRNVAATEIDGLAIADIAGPMYLGPEYDEWDADAMDYWKTFSITGTADGLSVVLLDDDTDGVPDIVDLVTSTNDNVQVSGKWLMPAMPLTGNAAGTTTIKVWRNGMVEAMTDLELDIATPDLATITVEDSDDVAQHGDFTDMFVYKDQYGVVMSGMMVVHADSPDGLVALGYTYELVDVVDADADGDYDDVQYTVVKWDGSISAVYTELNVSPWYPHSMP